MANKAKETTIATAALQTSVGTKYTVEKLRGNCRQLFGVSASTFAGATYGMTGKYTIEEMRNHIKEWGKKGVK